MRLLPAAILALTVSSCALGQTYTIQTIAGGGLATNIPGTSAMLLQPESVAVDGAGNVFFSQANSTVTRLDATTGILTVVAGNGTVGYSGDGGPATGAQLFFPGSNPCGVAVDSAGNLYIADAGNHVVRKVANGVITTVAGGGSVACDNCPATSTALSAGIVAVDPAGNLYIADLRPDINDPGENRIREVSNGMIATVAGNGNYADQFGGDGGPATSAELGFPQGVAVDSAGNLYIADTGNGRIREVSNGIITTVAGNGGRVQCDNCPATSSSLGASGVAVDSAGNLYIADGSARIRKVSNGVITTVAGGGGLPFGDGGPATSAQLYDPLGVAVDSTGNLYIADLFDERIREVSDGVIATVAGNGTRGISGNNGPATSAQLADPNGLAVDSAGNLYIADTSDDSIRKVSNGMIETVAGNGHCCFGGDGGPATSALLNFPAGVAVDSAGNIYIADTGNDLIRKVSNGVIATVAGNGAPLYGGDGGPATSAELDRPCCVAVDSVGNLYISDGNNRIRKVSNGVITTVAGNGTCGFAGDGGPATSAQLCPHGVAVDSVGNLYIADGYNSVIRKVSNGVITTVAGIATQGAPGGFSGDGGPATFAELDEPAGVAVDAAGNVYVADANNNRIRVLTPSCTLPAPGSRFTEGSPPSSPCRRLVEPDPPHAGK
jgi:sugar lactone lactonase YvrE